MEERGAKFIKLVEIMARLRGDDGCPWDKEQTKEKLRSYLIEESYEVLEAIDHNSYEKLKEELGDLLLQIVFLSRICEEEGKFDIFSVIDGICEKLIRRHPHVFGDLKVKDSAQVLKNWAEIKERERGWAHESSLADIPKGLPALVRARRVAEKASRVGFDWDRAEDICAKVKEELDEFKKALAKRESRVMEEELGDILFSIANLARFVKVDPEDALRRTIDKFVNRFEYIEMRLKEKGKSLEEASLEEMDRLWEEAKGR